MPDRIVRASILDSRAFNELTDEAEVLYRRLLSVVDDFGCYEADPELIQAKCFWRKADAWPVERIARAAVDICNQTNADGSVLMRQYEANGKKFLRIYKLGKPRAKKLRYPLPPGDTCGHEQTDACTCMQMFADANTRMQTQADVGACEQARANVRYSNTTTTTTTNKDSEKESDAAWREFERIYPEHRFDKERAYRAWLSRESEADKILAGLRPWVESEQWKERGGKFANWASKFISEGIYLIPPPPMEQESEPPSRYREWDGQS